MAELVLKKRARAVLYCLDREERFLIHHKNKSLLSFCLRDKADSPIEETILEYKDLQKQIERRLKTLRNRQVMIFNILKTQKLEV